MTDKSFNEVKEENMERLAQFIPIVERVHGKNHPEFFEVHLLFNQLKEKIQAEEGINEELEEEFNQLRNVTHRYAVPTDVCESYEAVYNMLEELDRAYVEQEIDI